MAVRLLSMVFGPTVVMLRCFCQSRLSIAGGEGYLLIQSAYGLVLLGACWVSLLQSKHTWLVAHAVVCRAVFGCPVGYTLCYSSHSLIMLMGDRVFSRWCQWIKAQAAAYVWDCYAGWCCHAL
jgi:hypothetical protein